MSQKKSFLLRLDPALWDALQAWADAELRSVNGQIEWVLRQALETRGRRAPEQGERRAGGKPGGSGKT
ncbi:MAG: hypothetical protein MUC63_08870 [Planctomycetes bacterium]|jgi:hypothetical protein|nr:hypothetical protein [Planctomycetota bacterium]